MLMVRLYEVKNDDGSAAELNIGLGGTFSREHVEDIRLGIAEMFPEGSEISELYERGFTVEESLNPAVVPKDSRSRFHMNIRPNIDVETDPYVLEALAKVVLQYNPSHELAIFDHRVSALGTLLLHTSTLNDDAVLAHGTRGANWER